ncbi:MAG: Ig-like domain-containing protein, partial [Planctomycetes bacterium]|nr:Ig-like domain-containing protein [Planctomycetota bacterium]
MVSSRFAAVALVLLLGAAFVACAQGRGGVPRPIDFAIRPATTSVPLGADLSLRVIATYQGGEQVDLTGRCEWTASPSGVATVGDTGSAKGVVTGLAPGSATITARDPASRSVATAALTVTPAAVTSVEVAPSNPRIALGTTRQFTATGTLTDGSTQDLTTAVTWSSSATGVATIDPAGLATSTAAGTTTITALHAPTGEFADTQLVVTAATLVSLQVTPTNPQVALGTTRQFTATGTFSDNTVQDLTTSVVWNSSAPGVATVGSAGLATSVAVGVATITATHAGSGVFGDTLLTVTPAVLASLQVTPTNPSIALGTTRQFTATGTYSDSTTQDLTTAVTWSSSATGVATVSNAASSEGRATSVATGTATITALHVGSGLSGDTVLTVTPAVLTSLAVTPTNPQVALGTTQQFTATGTYSDSTTQDLTTAVTWSSSATGVATVSNAASSEG